MKKTEFEHYLSDFLTILSNNNFTAKDFLFNAKPYVNGFFYIINTVNSLLNHQTIYSTRILDLGCGTGLSSYILARMGFDVDAIDVYDRDIDIISSFKQRGKPTQEKIWLDASLCANVSETLTTP